MERDRGSVQPGAEEDACANRGCHRQPPGGQGHPPPLSVAAAKLWLRSQAGEGERLGLWVAAEGLGPRPGLPVVVEGEGLPPPLPPPFSLVKSCVKLIFPFSVFSLKAVYAPSLILVTGL